MSCKHLTQRRVLQPDCAAHVYSFYMSRCFFESLSNTQRLYECRMRWVSRVRHTHHPRNFSNRTKEHMLSRLIAQGQALRVASQALPDHPRLHEGDSSGWEIDNFCQFMLRSRYIVKEYYL